MLVLDTNAKGFIGRAVGGIGPIDVGVVMGYPAPYTPVEQEADHEFCRD